MPINRFQTSEITTKKGFSAKGGVGKANQIEFTSDFSQVWSDTVNPAITADEFLFGNLSFSFLDRFELSAKYISDVGLAGSGKFQMVGTPGEKGFQISGIFQAGGGSETKEETDNTPTKAKLSNSFYGYDLILGYRTGKSFLIYTSAFMDHAEYKIKQSRGTDVRNFKGDSKNVGGTAGFSFDMSDNASVQVEFARAKTESGKSFLTSSAYGGAFTFIFP